MNKGILFGIGAYGLWGLLPIYWKLLHDVPAMEILSHRMVWSLVFLGLVLAARRQWRWLKPAVQDRQTVALFLGAAALLAINWGTYIWAVNAGFIVETSLGYFINPLLNVVLGMIFFGERLRPGQWLAVAFAGGGVIYLALDYGRLPWIALTLAASFGFYGLLKKKSRLQATEGLSLETLLLFVPALGYLIYLETAGSAAFGHLNLTTTLLLALTGVATAVPLLFFGAAAHHIPLSMLGLLQYIAPTIQFMLGVFLYREPFDKSQLLGFSLIWAALLIYSTEGLRHSRQDK